MTTNTLVKNVMKSLEEDFYCFKDEDLALLTNAVLNAIGKKMEISALFGLCDELSLNRLEALKEEVNTFLQAHFLSIINRDRRH